MLQHEIHKSQPFDSAEQEAALSVLRTGSMLESEAERFFKRFGISGATYNVLRILRGAKLQGLEGRPCHEIGEHMVAQVPDVTRLVDRLEKSGMVERARCSKDRRIVYVKITRAGLDLLKQIDEPLLALHSRQLGHMTREELSEIIRLLAKARTRPSIDAAAESLN